MNDDFTDYRPSTTSADLPDSENMESEIPEFGLLEVIEAFTAMRHEWRGQTRENRQLVEEIQAAAQRVGQLQDQLTALRSSPALTADDETSLKLVTAMAEIDWHLTRAAEAALGYETSSGASDLAELIEEMNGHYNQLGWLARRFSRRFYQALLASAEALAAERQARPNPTAEGLRLVVARVRRLMQDRHIERVDTLGKPFDAGQMNAIEAVDSANHASGQVIEQLSPAYLWRGRIVRYAEVRIAK